MPFFSRVFRSKDSSAGKKSAKQAAAEQVPAKPKWTDAYQRTEVAPEEVQELLRGCAHEIKSRGLDIPFLLLPFRPSSDPSAARTFIRNFFNAEQKRTPLHGDALVQELRLIEPMVLCSVVKWCWSRLPGGVVTWEAYELFKVGEQDSDLARDAFNTFIPISVESDARTKIIFDFFDLLTAIAAHGKSNGLGGRKLSRYAGWWAFEHTDTGNGFEASYKTWAMAADATSHLFFAYLRSISPDSTRGINGISALPIALQTLVQATEYPPQTPSLLQFSTTKVVMIVDTVSPTPFALLRRARNFEYRDSDSHLQEFSDYDDPVQALTDECARVLKAISTTNQSAVSTTKTSTSLRDASWSRFEDMGFGASIDSDPDDVVEERSFPSELRSAPQSRTNDLGRPTTPSWADFLSSGFADDNVSRGPPSLLLPPDKVLPPIGSVRGQSSQSHKRTLDTETNLEPGELASITVLDIDDSFWWVWISSLSGEEPASRKAVFGRCALLETVIRGAKWLVLEEQVKGAAPEPEAGAYIVEKKRFFGFSTRKKVTRTKSTAKGPGSNQPYTSGSGNATAPVSKTSIAPDQHARIQAAAAALQKKHREQEEDQHREANGRRARMDDTYSTKTNSVMTQYTGLFTEASSAMKWAKHYDNTYDKDQLRSAYLSDTRAGTGAPASLLGTNGRSMSDISEIRSDLQRPSSAGAEKALPVPVPPKDDDTPAKDAATPDATTVSSPEVKNNGLEETRKDSTEDQGQKKLKKKPVGGNSAFKGIFSSTKQRTAEEAPKKEIGIDPSAVAAARAALENKVKSQDSLPTPKSLNTGRLDEIKKNLVPEGPTTGGSPHSEKTATPSPPSKLPKKATTTKSAPAAAPETAAPAPAPAPPAYGPPRTRRDIEYDALSRIDTNEKAAAEREFSSFDQGPLADQPAFAPSGDSPITPAEEHFPESKTEAVVPAVDSPRDIATPTATTGPESAKTSPYQDRWAQIRKNAAERAAAATAEEIHSRTSQADDGDTSGEETIESRVARIKARVAELTGNMEAAR